ncbi:hypothetical protein BX666DRAFT_275778 [Dichotomocladium elegans]|nr:hypothetical protein BX666DRAFT_275778 [Dichotomocladium elegans]
MDDDFELIGARALGGFKFPADSDKCNELDSILYPSPLVKESSLDKPVEPLQFRVLFVGSTSVERHKTLVLKKLSEALASTLPQRKQQPVLNNNFREKIHNIVFLDAFESSPVEIYEDAGLHMIEADFLGPDNMDRVTEYLQKTSEDNQQIDVVVYFFSLNTARDQAEQDMCLLRRINDRDIPVWPLLSLPHERPPSVNDSRNLRSPSFVRPQVSSSTLINSLSTRSDLTQNLSDYLDEYKIKTIDLAGINPEIPNFMQEDRYRPMIALTVDQFTTIHSEDVAQILQKYRKPTRIADQDEPAKQQRWLGNVAGNSVTVILGMVFIVLATAILAIAKSSRRSSSLSFSTSESSISTTDVPTDAESVRMRLNPMWDVVDDETLRHLFMVELSTSDRDLSEEALVVLLDTDQLIEKEFKMIYEPKSHYNFVVDVPSPCLIHSDEDIVARVFWRYAEDARTKVEKLIDQVVLSRETCQPVYDRRGLSRGCQPRSALTVVRRRYPHISWKLLFSKFKAESRKLTEAMITVCQTLLKKFA